MTNIEKYKSIAIKINSYNRAKPMAKKKYMSIGSFVRYLINKKYSEVERSIQINTGEKNASYTN